MKMKFEYFEINYTWGYFDCTYKLTNDGEEI